MTPYDCIKDVIDVLIMGFYYTVQLSALLCLYIYIYIYLNKHFQLTLLTCATLTLKNRDDRVYPIIGNMYTNN